MNNDIYIKYLYNEYNNLIKVTLNELKIELENKRKIFERDIEIFESTKAILNSNGIKEKDNSLIYNNVNIYSTNTLDKEHDNSKLDEVNEEIEDIKNKINNYEKELKFSLVNRKQIKDQLKQLTTDLGVLERQKQILDNAKNTRTTISNLTDKQKELIKYYFLYQDKLKEILNIEKNINKLTDIKINEEILNIVLNNFDNDLKEEINNSIDNVDIQTLDEELKPIAYKYLGIRKRKENQKKLS